MIYNKQAVVQKRQPLIWGLLSILIIPTIVWVFRARKDLMALTGERIMSAWFCFIPLVGFYWWYKFSRTLIQAQASGGLGLFVFSLLCMSVSFSFGVDLIQPFMSLPEMVIFRILAVLMYMSIIVWGQFTLNKIIDQQPKLVEAKTSRLITFCMLAHLLVTVVILVFWAVFYLPIAENWFGVSI